MDVCTCWRAPVRVLQVSANRTGPLLQRSPWRKLALPGGAGPGGTRRAGIDLNYLQGDFRGRTPFPSHSFFLLLLSAVLPELWILLLFILKFFLSSLFSFSKIKTFTRLSRLSFSSDFTYSHSIGILVGSKLNYFKYFPPICTPLS